jgi:hypothetical protein
MFSINYVSSRSAILTGVTVLLLSGSNLAWCQSQPSDRPPLPRDSKGLEAVKKRMTERLDKEIDRLTALEDCIQAAKNLEELRACRPARPGNSMEPPMPPASQ